MKFDKSVFDGMIGCMVSQWIDTNIYEFEIFYENLESMVYKRFKNLDYANFEIDNLIKRLSDDYVLIDHSICLISALNIRKDLGQFCICFNQMPVIYFKTKNEANNYLKTIKKINRNLKYMK